MVLGAIKRRYSAHGYAIHRDFVKWRIETWTVIRPGSIYHALEQMEKQSLIVEVSDHGKKLGPSKTEYKLTVKGEHQFVALLELALKDINLIELSAGIAFMEYLPRQKVVELLRQRLIAQERISYFLKTLPVEGRPDTPSKHPELIRIWSDNYADAAASTEKLITAIKSGKYVFKDEEE